MMILRICNLSLLFLVLNLIFFCVCKFLKFCVVFNIKSIIIYNYTISCKIYLYSIRIIFKK
jgi:hypothetical protein